MAIESKTIQINGVNYYMTAHPGRQGLALQFKLIKILSPLLLGVMGDDKKLEVALKNSIMAMSEKEFEELIVKGIFCYTKRSGVELSGLDFDNAYAQNYAEMYEAIITILEFNFGSILEEALKKSTGLKEIFLGIKEANKTPQSLES